MLSLIILQSDMSLRKQGNMRVMLARIVIIDYQDNKIFGK